MECFPILYAVLSFFFGLHHTRPERSKNIRMADACTHRNPTGEALYLSSVLAHNLYYEIKKTTHVDCNSIAARC